MGFIIFFQQWLRYIVTIIFVSKKIIFYLSYPIYKYTVIFIGVENRSTRRKSLTYRKSRTRYVFEYTSPGAEIELTTLVGIWCQLLFFIHF
jgi:hypothetical protein